jgi:hypothetical protein
MVDPLRVRVTGALAPFAEGFVVAVAEAGIRRTAAPSSCSCLRI